MKIKKVEAMPHDDSQKEHAEVEDNDMLRDEIHRYRTPGYLLEDDPDEEE